MVQVRFRQGSDGVPAGSDDIQIRADEVSTRFRGGLNDVQVRSSLQGSDGYRRDSYEVQKRLR